MSPVSKSDSPSRSLRGGLDLDCLPGFLKGYETIRTRRDPHCQMALTALLLLLMSRTDSQHVTYPNAAGSLSISVKEWREFIFPAGRDRGRGRAVDDGRARHNPQRDAQGDRGGPVGLPALAQSARQGQDGQAQVRQCFLLAVTPLMTV